jgi:hypothetical protein
MTAENLSRITTAVTGVQIAAGRLPPMPKVPRDVTSTGLRRRATRSKSRQIADGGERQEIEELSRGLRNPAIPSRQAGIQQRSIR